MYEFCLARIIWDYQITHDFETDRLLNISKEFQERNGRIFESSREDFQN